MPPRTPRGFRRSDNLHLQRPAPCDQVRDDRDGDVRDGRVSLPAWTTRCARSCASSSPSSAFALMRSMIPNPSRRAASSTSESRLPILAARTLTWRIRPSSIASVVFTRAISPYYHLAGEILHKVYSPRRLRQRTPGRSASTKENSGSEVVSPTPRLLPHRRWSDSAAEPVVSPMPREAATHRASRPRRACLDC